MSSTPAELAWLAGIIEGEGCINVHTTHKIRGGERRAYPYPQIRVRMTDEDTILKCASVASEFGGGMYGPFKNPSVAEHHKAMFQWTITGQPCRLLLNQLLPWFGKRRTEEAERAMA